MLLMPVLTLPEAPSLTDAVVAAVRTGVQQQELVPGEVYSVYQLADLLGVSRSPVREALLRLAEVGLVEIARNRGFRVVLPTAHDVEEIFEIRLALEPAAAGRAAERGCPDLAGLLSRMARAAAGDDEPAFWAADRAVHRAILLAAGNRRAADVVEQLRATTALLGPPTTATGRSLAEILDEHRPIVDAVVAGDAALAETAMRTHLEHTRDLLVVPTRPCSLAGDPTPARAT